VATVRELVVALGLDFDSSGFAKADAAIRVLRTGFFGVGAVIGGLKAALTGITVSMAKQAGEVYDTATALGVTTDAIQKLGYAAQLSGSNAEQMRAALTHIGAAAAAAASGNKEMAQSFGGIGLHDMNGGLKTADRLLLDLANKMQGMKNPTEKAALAAQLLGRQAGPRMVQLLSQGEAGIAALGDELESLGGVIDEDFIESSRALNDSIERVQVVIKSVGLIVARAFIPAVQKMTKGIVDWWKANRQIIDSRLTFFVQRLASAFEGIGLVVDKVIEIFSGFGGGVSPAGKMMMLLAGAAMTLAAAMLLPAAPIIILSGLILALLDDINEFSKGNESLIGDVVKEWQNFLNVFREIDAEAKGFEAVITRIARIVADLFGMMFGGKSGRRRSFEDFMDATGVTALGNALQRSDSAQERADAIEKFGVRATLAGKDPAQTINNAYDERRAAMSSSSAINVGGITVNAAPGEDPKKIAEMIASKLEDMRQRELESARGALLPGPVAPAGAR
jgi:hypothetical protein